MADVYLKRAELIAGRLNELATSSEDPSCITRTYGSSAFVEGRSKVAQWMKDAGLYVVIDNTGNVRGRLNATRKTTKTFVLGSHIDSVNNAGKFDGPLGVLMAIDLVNYVSKSGFEVPFNIEVVGFCDEEGCRFHTTYIGSRALTGSLDDNTLQVKDKKGISLLEAIREGGGDVNNLRKDALAKQDWLGYFEIHIEQGPVLFERNIPIGVVTGIAGQRRTSIVLRGEAGHAGTVPMDRRKDAMVCAAEFIVKAEELGKAYDGRIVVTTGQLDIVNAASNVIPGEVVMSLDVRSDDDTLLSTCCDQLREVLTGTAERRNIKAQWKEVQRTTAVKCDEQMNKLLVSSIVKAGYEVVEMVSGAGHDAVPISTVSPVAMLFVRCYKGISHNPLENVELSDMAAAIKVSDNFIQQLINYNTSLRS